MAALNLFPSRVAFVDAQGRLTPEAYRALMALYDRVGGSFGDQGIDVFGGSISAPSDLPMISEVVTQPLDAVIEWANVSQPQTDPLNQAEMVFQPESDGAGIAPVALSASPFSFVAQQEGFLSFSEVPTTNATFSRGGVTIELGIISGVVPMRTGDIVTLTYVGSPIVNFIPR